MAQSTGRHDNAVGRARGKAARTVWRLGALWIALGLTTLLAACMGMATPAPTDSTTTDSAATDSAVAEASPAATVEGDTARIVVQLDDSRLRVRTVEFSAPISGLAALQSSGLPVVTADFSWGTGVCSIADVGCPADDCFCGGDAFWNYAYVEDGAWQGYGVGAAQSVISETGAVEGWRWGTGDGSLPDPDRIDAVYAALANAQAQQDATDGSYAGSMGASLEMMLALAANQMDAGAWRAAPDAPSLLDFVEANAAEYTHENGGAAGKLAVSLAAAGRCWPAGALKPSETYTDVVAVPPVDTGFFAWSVLGQVALDEPVDDAAVQALIDLALPDGGWEWGQGFGRDTNTTALVLQVLAATGVPADEPVVTAAFDYLRSAQTESGGFSYDPGVGRGEADVNSTAYVVQALAAWGEDPTGDAWQQPNGTPVDFLLSLQGEDGALSWQAAQPAPNLAATQQAIPALLGQPYPVQRRALPMCDE